MTVAGKELEHVIIGTAGHIDHGKTALVKALTGYDTDSLAEEKKRGITIELGFAFLKLPELDKQLVFIDVPGHEKLVKTMVAGASNIDTALLVIAADEGIMPQTREHFEVLQLLGIPNGIIAVAKTDLVDKETLSVAVDEIREYLNGTFLETAPIIEVSAVTGDGIDRLKSALTESCREQVQRKDSGIFRMPIDRVFSMKGFGTVIAGTDLSGKVAVGDTIEIYPDRFSAKIRGIQMHHHKVSGSAPGRRTALNLQSIDKSLLRRGQTAAAPGSLTVSDRFDAELKILHSARRGTKNRSRIRLHVNTDEIIARVVIIDKDLIAPGESGLVQFLLERPAVAVRGDRFVIRTFSPVLTIGGGRIIDPAPERHKRFDEKTINALTAMTGDSENAVEQYLIGRGCLPVSLEEISAAMGKDRNSIADLLSELSSRNRIIALDSGAWIHIDSLNKLKHQIEQIIRQYLGRNRYRKFISYSEVRSQILQYARPNLFELALRILAEENVVEQKSGQIGLVGYEPALTPLEETLKQSVLEVFEQSGFSPPLESEVRERVDTGKGDFENVISILIDTESLVRLNDKVTYHTDYYQRIKQIVIDHIKHNGSIDVKTLRDVLGVSRKYALAILEHFDQIGLTKRVEDHRVLA